MTVPGQPNLAAFKINLPTLPMASDLAIPQAPVGVAAPFMQGVAVAPKPEERLVCWQLLPEDQLPAYRQAAAAYYPQMLVNTPMMMTFGNDSVKGMNTLIDRLLREVEPIKVPELTDRMRGLNAQMRKIRGKYDITDSRIKEDLERWAEKPRKMLGFIGDAVSLIDAMMTDAMATVDQLDHVGGLYTDKAVEMTRNVHMYDEMYGQNEAEINNVLATIAMMELIVELARAEVESIQANPDDPAQRNLVERRRYVAEFATNMAIRITEFKNRLFIGWTTSPNITTMRTLDVGLAQRLYLFVNLTIPTMKSTLLQWRMMIQAVQAAQFMAVGAEEANSWSLAYARASAQGIPLIAEQVQTPSLAAGTISAIADAIAQQADGMVTAYENGIQRRAEVDNAMVQAQRIIQNADAKVSDAVVRGLIAQATKPVILDVTPTTA